MRHALKTVLWGLAGIRRKSEADKPVNPVHIVFTAVTLVIVFILVLVTIVRIVTS